MMNPFTLHKLLDRGTLICGGWKPYLTFDFVLTTHQFNPTPFFREYQDRKIVRDKVWELHNKGWGYTKIHHYLDKIISAFLQKLYLKLSNLPYLSLKII